MKKTEILPSAVSFLLLFAFLIAFIPAPRAYAADASGVCGKEGDDLTWSYSKGVLTVAGQGEMADYEREEDIPWGDVRSEIARIELPEGLTRVGSRAFMACVELTSVELPESLTGIGEYAFYFCAGLTSIEFPGA